MTTNEPQTPTAPVMTDAGAQPPANRLQGDMGVVGLVMTVLAFSAPLTTVAGFIPVLLTFGGSAAPVMYLLITVLLVVFSAGFTTMARRVPNPGGFYAFITQGLGRPAGLGAAFLATFGYVLIGFFAPPFFAVTLQSYITGFGGPEIPWIWYGLAVVALTTALAFRQVDLSARVLITIMLLESAAVLVFDIAAFLNGTNGGSAGVSLPNLADSGIGVALLFTVGNFLGFEATVIYREEVRNPDRTIPRATFLAVGGIGLFYALAAFAYLFPLGSDSAQDAATKDTAGLFNNTATALIGKTFTDIVTLLLITSVIAAALSIHNASARYLHSLGTDNVLHAHLGRVHPRHHSPYVSAALVGLLWAVSAIIFSIAGESPVDLYVKTVGIGSLAILLLLFGASIAITVFFLKNRDSQVDSVWNCYIAPVLATLGLGYISYLAVANYSALVGASGPVTWAFLAITFAIPVVGIAHALVLREKRPAVYRNIGRQELE